MVTGPPFWGAPAVGWLASGGGLGGGGRVGLGLRLGGGVLTGGVGAVQGLVLTATYLLSVGAGRRVLGGGVGLSYLLLGVVLGSGLRLGGSGSRPGLLVGAGLDVQDGVESDLM